MKYCDNLIELDQMYLLKIFAYTLIYTEFNSILFKLLTCMYQSKNMFGTT